MNEATPMTPASNDPLMSHAMVQRRDAVPFVQWPRNTVRFATLLSLLVLVGRPSVGVAQEKGPLFEKASLSRARGAEDAPLFVYEFADFECPHCAQFATEVFPRIDSAFVRTGKVRWIFVNLPLPSHERAWIAHEAAVCAGAVSGRFWEMHDRIFENQKTWSEAPDPAALLASWAKELGVAMQPFAQCTANDQVASLLLQDVIFAATSRVNGTPAFIVNNEQSVMGLKTFEEWKAILEPMIKAKAKK
jgi:protein-disulfide isomerase